MQERQLTTIMCFPSKKSLLYPGKIVVPSKPSWVLNGVLVHSHAPPLLPRPLFSTRPAVGLCPSSTCVQSHI